MKTLKHISILFFVLLASFTASAQLAPKINLPGTLKDADGAAVADGNYTVEFKLYNQQNGGTSLWSETATVSTKGGLYNHLLGSITPLSAEIFDVTLFLGVKIGTYEMEPRTELTYAPYTFASSTALFANKVVCSGAIGDIKYSILNPTQFAAKNGDCWVPMDGTTRPGSKLANILGTANVAPDVSGLFLRGHEYAIGANNDPDRTSLSPIATVQNDAFLRHNHTASTSEAGGHSHNTNFQQSQAENGANSAKNRISPDSENSDDFPGNPAIKSTDAQGNHAHAVTINASGGMETRPKNLNLYVYIRIN